MSRLADWWGSNSKNPNILYVVDPHNDEGVVAPDPLGAAATFIYKNRDIIIISGDIESIRIIAEEYALPLTKSINFQIQRIALGNGGYDSSPYNEIETLPPFSYISLSEKGMQVYEYSILSEINQNYSYLDLLSGVKEDILKSITAIGNAGIESKVSHITGGFDSRLLLSAVLKLGLQEQFHYFCSGPTGSTDRVIADSITQYYSLRRIKTAGLSSGPTKNITEQLVSPLFHSHGIATTGPNGRERPVPILAVGGGYGGLLRTTFGERMRNLRLQSNGRDIFAAYDPYYKHDASVLSNSGLRHIRAAMETEWTKLGEYYTEDHQLGDALYLHVRNRFHFGYNSMQWSRIGSRVDPLYSVHGYFFSIKSTSETRSSNIIGFDLLSSFCAELLSFPFDKPKFDHHLIGQSRPLYSSKKHAPWSQEKYFDFLNPNFSDKRILPESCDPYILERPHVSPEERKSFIQYANKIGLNYWQIENLAPAQSILRKVLTTIPRDDLSEYFDHSYLTHLGKDKLANRVEIRNLYAALGTLVWLAN